MKNAVEYVATFINKQDFEKEYAQDHIPTPIIYTLTIKDESHHRPILLGYIIVEAGECSECFDDHIKTGLVTEEIGKAFIEALNSRFDNEDDDDSNWEAINEFSFFAENWEEDEEEDE
ncbi:MAG: hypothetical protein ACXW0Q_00010 [Methylovulum sp.]